MGKEAGLRRQQLTAKVKALKRNARKGFYFNSHQFLLFIFSTNIQPHIVFSKLTYSVQHFFQSIENKMNRFFLLYHFKLTGILDE